jgi:hypothetical protein
MVRCPKCNRTYENDSQKFCTRDGGRLMPVEAEAQSFDPNATMVAGAEPFNPNATVMQPEPCVSQPSFDPNATILSPTPSMPPQDYSAQQDFPTMASIPPPEQSQPIEAAYISQPSMPSQATTEDITPSPFSQSQPSIPSQPQGTPSQPLPIPMPARYDPTAPTSADLTLPSNVTPPPSQPSGDLGQSTFPLSSSQPSTDFGYRTAENVPPPNYSQGMPARASADLQMPPGMDMQTQAPASQSAQPYRTTSTGELTTPPVRIPAVQTPVAIPQSHTIAVAQKKSSKKMLFLGLGAVILSLLVIVAAAGVFVVTQRPEWIGLGKNKDENRNTSIDENKNTNTTNTNANVNNSNADENKNTNDNTDTTSTPPLGTKPFVNRSSDLSGDLASHFVPFSFNYPENWDVTTGKGYFIEVTRKLPDGFQQENVSVSYYESKGTLDADRADIPTLVQKYSTQLAPFFPGYQKVSEGETNINGLIGYEFRFRGLIHNQEKGDVKVYGRHIFLPPGKEGEKDGVRLILYGTSLAPELQSMDDFSVKGQLPVVLNSFKMGQ